MSYNFYISKPRAFKTPSFYQKTRVFKTPPFQKPRPFSIIHHFFIFFKNTGFQKTPAFYQKHGFSKTPGFQ